MSENYNNAELDYKTMFEQLAKRAEAAIKREEEYFALLRKCQELTPFTDMASKRITEMRMCDQIPYIRAIVRSAEIAKKLCERYHWDDEIDVDEME